MGLPLGSTAAVGSVGLILITLLLPLVVHIPPHAYRFCCRCCSAAAGVVLAPPASAMVLRSSVIRFTLVVLYRSVRHVRHVLVLVLVATGWREPGSLGRSSHQFCVTAFCTEQLPPRLPMCNINGFAIRLLCGLYAHVRAGSARGTTVCFRAPLDACRTLITLRTSAIAAACSSGSAMVLCCCRVFPLPPVAMRHRSPLLYISLFCRIYDSPCSSVLTTGCATGSDDFLHTRHFTTLVAMVLGLRYVLPLPCIILLRTIFQFCAARACSVR